MLLLSIYVTAAVTLSLLSNDKTTRIPASRCSNILITRLAHVSTVISSQPRKGGTAIFSGLFLCMPHPLLSCISHHLRQSLSSSFLSFYDLMFSLHHLHLASPRSYHLTTILMPSRRPCLFLSSGSSRILHHIPIFPL